MNISTISLTLVTVEPPQYPGARVTWCMHEPPHVVSLELGDHQVDPEVVVESTRGAIAPRRRGPGGRTAKLDRQHYERVAARYRSLTQQGVSSPLRALAQELGMTYDNASRQVTTCRRMGLV